MLSLCDLDEAIRLRKRQRPKQNSIDGGENGSVGARAKRQSQDDGQGEARRPKQRAYAVSDVSEKSLDANRDIRITCPFGMKGGISESPPRLPAGLVCVETVRTEFVCAFGKVEGNLAFDVALNSCFAKNIG